jgi:hypothetical protein
MREALRTAGIGRMHVVATNNDFVVCCAAYLHYLRWASGLARLQDSSNMGAGIIIDCRAVAAGQWDKFRSGCKTVVMLGNGT